jgi:hypothetical protein
VSPVDIGANPHIVDLKVIHYILFLIVNGKILNGDISVCVP